MRARVAIVGPAERPSRELSLGANHCILLFNSEPRLFVEGLVEYFLCVHAEVGVSGLEHLARAVLPFVSVSHNEDVIALSEGITVKRHGPHDDLRVICLSLETRRAVVVPLGEV